MAAFIGIIKVRKISKYREIEGNVQVLSQALWCTVLASMTRSSTSPVSLQRMCCVKVRFKRV